MANDDYLISVALPFHYDERPDVVWPVIFVLDGNMHFNMVVDMVRFMNIRVEFCNELPDALIVGIGYPVTRHADGHAESRHAPTDAGLRPTQWTIVAAGARARTRPRRAST